MLYCREFYEQHEIRIIFTDEAIELLGKEAAKQARSALQICQQRFKDYQFGLNLIQKNTGRSEFELGIEAVADADAFLSECIVQSYKQVAEQSDGGADSGGGIGDGKNGVDDI